MRSASRVHGVRAVTEVRGGMRLGNLQGTQQEKNRMKDRQGEMGNRSREPASRVPVGTVAVLTGIDGVGIGVVRNGPGKMCRPEGKGFLFRARKLNTEIGR